ncbi:MAG TPA: cupin domain-containing protein [Actinophytocola sp.]|uniref:cupin domain-containing protein n=1 Tax=Actinophytocola sp. TaxID=1872138 RepID=UPI002DBC3ACF|nr:cupin domain-containing protein [Actinophytocola sp.]HEU5474989.1 cupin domain-containing protein [Actinophytocola sp.]
MSTDRPALRRCIGIEPAEFAERYWGRGLLLTPAGSAPWRFDDLLTLDGVDELLSRRGLRTPFLRLARNGTVLSSAQFTGPAGAGAEISDQVTDEAVLRLFEDGSTLVLQALHRMWPPLIEFAGQLTQDLGHPVQVNAYLTPADAQGFAAHYDTHDVFVLQLAGRKRWLIHEPVHRDPLRDQPWANRAGAVSERAGEPPLLDHVLEPGDALYLPRGYLHSATALGELSAHLTVGVHVLTRYALVEALCALAAGEPELRTSLPMALDPDDLGTELRPAVQALIRYLRAADPAEVTRLVRDRLWAGSRPQPIGPLAQSRAARSVRLGSRIRLRPGLRHALRYEGDRVLLDLPGDQLSLPAVTGPALVELLGGAPVAVGELPGIDLDDQLVLVRRLLREGLVVPVAGQAAWAPSPNGNRDRAEA